MSRKYPNYSGRFSNVWRIQNTIHNDTKTLLEGFIKITHEQQGQQIEKSDTKKLKTRSR